MTTKPLKDIKCIVSKAENGYTINFYDGDIYESILITGCYVALSADEVGLVIAEEAKVRLG